MHAGRPAARLFHASSAGLTRRHCLALVAAGALPAALRTVSAAPSPAAEVAVPALALRQHRLANGLQVVSLPMAGLGTVAVQVWYRVGGKDDPAGRSGFAHLFEHLMFKRTRRMPDEMFDRLTEDVGGVNNAFTAEDMTVYQSEVPANHLQRLLWAEAERMANLQVTQASFASERQVVIEELHQRVLANPYGRLFNALPRQLFERHPYQRPVIGSQADLEAATLADVQRFHATYYRPDNAMLVVAGGFDAARLDAGVARWFAPLAAPAQPVPRVAEVEPPRQRDARAALRAPSVPLPAVALLWKGPGAAHADASALQVAAALLSSGDSSRLYQALVYRARSAQSAGLAVDLYADAGMIAGYAIAAHGHELRALEAALLDEISRLAERGPDTAELDKVRTQLVTGAVLSQQSPADLAQAIGNAGLLLGDVQAVNQVLPRLQAVTGADVQRVLRRWLLEGHRVTLDYLQEAA